MIKRTSILLTALFIVLLIGTFILATNHTFFPNWLAIGYWGISVLLAVLLLGNPKNRSLYKLDGIQVVFIYTVCFLLLQYIGGIFIGFTRSPYDLSLLSIIKNCFPILLLIILEEWFRKIVIAKAAGHIVLEGLLILLLAGFQISYQFSSYQLDSAMAIFTLFGELILPSLANSALLSYMTKHYTCESSILYRIILECYLYWFPIYPDYGTYIYSVLRLILPLTIFLHLNSLQATKQFEKIHTKRKISDIVLQVVTVIFLIVVVGLTSGLFRYQAIAIISNSMVPTFQRGDVLIIEKLSEEEKESLEVGEIIAYSNGSRVIVHRIVTIEKDSSGNIYFTKGDANETEDDYEIYPEAIIGTANYRIPWIGYPTVWINEAWS